ncbi:adenylosuccinate lyase [Anaeromyxobacter dehalogenans 2CP-1]|uniref:Adenylosuccinate lyase n=1 Tax=Anaeromyxobacter dehalogenans (strain ATCC BAA-258 / DSM 21875 / 2CP-1) TaxID=455488 RepID=B8JFZ3_ANAD2|nr:adenylosuccinate lyase [Anaeromyxobacter dehalogenans]ACL64581.1 adenylosuccinate lyase [Anaeromyxobacter dehalogenans 2CP-1]
MIPRYTRPDMGRIWTSEHRFRIWLDVELAACEAMVRLGEVPPEDFEALRKAFAGFEFTAADVARIDEIERTVKHDVIAFLTFVEEKGGPAARHLHKGMTSSDVLDTTLAVQLRDASRLLLAGVDRVLAAVRKRAFEHRRTPMVGRSHGIHAEPITFGLKLAGWYDAWTRRRAALARAAEGVAVGKISGAVGTFANVDPRVEAFVMEKVGLAGGEGAATQVVNRDRHAELFTALALCGATLEQQAVEVRHLQRTEVREAEEPFTAGQKGSSAMPHKRNPILSENLTGLARLLRGYALAAMEDVALWHERDISHSSVERVIGPDATIALDFALHRFAGMIENLRVYPERMRENLDLTGGLYEAQRVLLALVGKGVARQQGYVFVQRNAMKVWEEKVDFRTALKRDPDVSRLLTADEVDACFALDYHLKHVDTIFRRVFGEA